VHMGRETEGRRESRQGDQRARHWQRRRPVSSGRGGDTR
jgi:hypothetical protein